ncbi:CPBP family intramembrane glutamic endopeptidase [Christiangramia sabulilitoris]|uniref:CPBP family intramembrane metalloprotease n=1 Tax=Christiangramia sabulilitoris TaxID=2583991 RepID=A0A550I3Q5_9FLAO|nr:CPBP family intramembrane glutamic endopeptidase [Christiangramia sabulilitoris]TRO65607.1 CPBP family intramembrane metalloprotease [Christiangramia sabulilitoris]
MRKLFHTKKSWLPIMGLSSLLFGFAFLLFLSAEFVQSSRNHSDISIGVMMFAAIIVAPLFEELFFRGFFTGKNWLKWTGVTGLFLFVLLGELNLLAIGLLLGFLTCYFAYVKFQINSFYDFAILLNILLFTVVHYKMEELIDPDLFFLAFFQFGLGAIFTWLVLNYGILKSILFHSAWNGTMMIIMLLAIQYPGEELHKYENSRVYVEWNRSPRFDSHNTFVQNVNNDTLIGRHVEARYLYKFLNGFDKEEMRSENLRLLQTENYMRYNFKAVIKTSDDNDLKKGVTDFLFEKKLIYFLEN